MSRFNLIDEKWIPVRFLDGSRDEVGLSISDVLLRSKEIAAIEESSPLVVAALHRFLLAVLYRALEGPTDIKQAEMLFKTGLPTEKITAYLERWRDRFWLFHEEYPFGQIPTFKPGKWRAWTVLAAEHNADNAKVLFDHVDVKESGTISEASATRWILATQTFSVSCGKSELSHTGTSPSATAAMVLPLGRDLHDTLLFALFPQNRKVAVADLPLWERYPETVESLKNGIERSSSGIADRYTWRIRSIRLMASDTGKIAKLAFASGVGNTSLDQIDPMLAYRIDEKSGKLPIQFRDRGLWRDFHSLLPDSAGLAPQVIEHAKKLSQLNQKRFPRSLMVLGQSNNKAKIEYWRMERFALPAALAGDRHIRNEIHQLLTKSEEVHKSLLYACRSFARNILSRGDRKPDGKDITGFIEQMMVISWYWSTLETHFHEILEEYSIEDDFEIILYKWLRFVQRAVETAWAQHSASVSMGDAWVIRALVKAEKTVQDKLTELNAEILLLIPKKEAS